MAKVIIDFTLPEEQEDLRVALDGYKWRLVVWDFNNKLRETLKYDVSHIGDEQVSELEYKIAEKYQQILLGLIEEYKVIMD
jgi:hypothetical protein